MKSNESKFDNLDSRVVLEFRKYEYTIQILQIDILRVIKILESVNSNQLADKFKRIIFILDHYKNTFTDLERNQLPKSDINKEILSSKDFVELKYHMKDLDRKMEGYYAKTKAI
jgi:hypothetical protein